MKPVISTVDELLNLGEVKAELRDFMTRNPLSTVFDLEETPTDFVLINVDEKNVMQVDNNMPKKD